MNKTNRQNTREIEGVTPTLSLAWAGLSTLIGRRLATSAPPTRHVTPPRPADTHTHTAALYQI